MKQIGLDITSSVGIGAIYTIYGESPVELVDRVKGPHSLSEAACLRLLEGKKVTSSKKTHLQIKW